MSQDRNEEYIAAHRLAKEMFERGEIINFSCSYSRERGRMIHIETDQGWCPDPLFEDFSDDVSGTFYY